jgi:drug/metabolite transporter (DMT)-like permease
VLLGAVLALLAATMFAVCAVAQHRAVLQSPAESAASTAGPLGAGLLLRLVRRPLWLLGTVADVAGFVLQVLALALAPLVLVQPLLVCGLLVAAPLSALVDRRRLSWPETAGVLLCSGGLALFVAVAGAAAGRTSVPFSSAVPLLVVTAVLLVVGVAGATLLPTGPARSVVLAALCGVFYGVSSALVKLVTPDLSPAALLTNWALYALLVIAGTGFVLNQTAFQTDRLAAPLATLTVLEPVAALLVGLTLLRESVDAGPGHLAAYAAAAAMVVAGVVLLSRPAATREASSAVSSPDYATSDPSG